MSGATALDRFVQECSARLTELAAGGGQSEVFREGAAEFAAAVANMRPVDRERTTVPVVSTLPSAPPAPLLTAALDAQPEIPWIPSHRMTDGGTEAALAPLNEVRDFGDVIVGLLALAPGAAYPEHSHPPQEIYLPITGGGRWRFGGAQTYRQLERGELVYNHPNDRHGIVAEEHPVLAMYVLWGASL